MTRRVNVDLCGSAGEIEAVLSKLRDEGFIEDINSDKIEDTIHMSALTFLGMPVHFKSSFIRDYKVNADELRIYVLEDEGEEVFQYINFKEYGIVQVDGCGYYAIDLIYHDATGSYHNVNYSSVKLANPNYTTAYLALVNKTLSELKEKLEDIGARK